MGYANALFSLRSADDASIMADDLPVGEMFVASCSLSGEDPNASQLDFDTLVTRATASSSVPIATLTPDRQQPSKRPSSGEDPNLDTATASSSAPAVPVLTPDREQPSKRPRSASQTTEPIATRKKRRLQTRPAAAQALNEFRIQFKGNDSSKWHGKTISIDTDWMSELYGGDEPLWPGRVIEIPFADKNWKAIITKIPGVWYSYLDIKVSKRL